MNIIGHQKQLNILNKSIEKNKLAQAYLFLGPENVGKFTIALKLAEKLTGESSQKINSNLIIIQPEINMEKENTESKKTKNTSKKREVKIEQIRELQRKFSFFSGEGKYKIAIIDEADRLNKQAQNALLKTLEEPNDFSIVILVTKNEKKLLPTIISRCQKMKFGPLADEEIKKWSEKEKLFSGKEKEKDEIIFWSFGRPGLILKLSNDKEELEKRKKALSDLKNLTNQNLTEKFFLAEEMSKDRELSREELNFWTIILRQIFLKRIEIKIPAAKVPKLIEEINKSLEILKDTNANAKLILENLLLKF